MLATQDEEALPFWTIEKRKPESGFAKRSIACRKCNRHICRRWNVEGSRHDLERTFCDLMIGASIDHAAPQAENVGPPSWFLAGANSAGGGSDIGETFKCGKRRGKE